MKKLHLFRLLFAAMLVTASTAFMGCSDDDDEMEVPTLGVSPQTLAFDENGGAKTFDITTTGYWKITGADGQNWFALTPALTGTGSQTITVTVDTDSQAHATDLKVSVYMDVFGQQKEVDSKTVKITQTPGGDLPSDEVIYGNNFDKEKAEKVNERWPYLDQTEVWKNAEGTGISTVTYASKSASVRSSQKQSGGYDNASGSNKIFFGSLPASFSIENITMPAEALNYRLVFGGAYSLKTGDVYDNIFKPESFVLTLGDGTGWSGNVTYEKIGGDDTKDPYWVYYAANFTLPKAVGKLSIKFEAKIASVFAIDDVKLTEGLGGQLISFDGGTPPQPSEEKVITIPELNAACVAAGDSQVVLDAANDRYFEAIVMNDVAAGNYAFNNLILATEGATAAGNGITLYGSQVEPSTLGLTMGDKVKVTLYAGQAKATVFQTMNEITGGKDATWAKVEKIGSGATITPVEIASNKIADYQGMAVVIKNATLAGSGVWCTADTEGKQQLTAAAGAFSLYIKKNATAFVGQPYEAATGNISGIAVCSHDNTQLSPRNLNDVKAFMGSTPMITTVNPDKLTFDAAGGSKTVKVVTANTDDTYTLTTVLAEQNGFTATVSGDVVTVVAAASTTDKTNTLTIKLMKGGNEVDSKTLSMTQSKPSSGNESEIFIDFMNEAGYPVDFPKLKAEMLVEAKTFGFSGFDLTFAGSTGGGYYKNYMKFEEKKDPYILIGKKDAYIELPAIEGKALASVTFEVTSGASKKVTVGIADSSNNLVSGGESKLLDQKDGRKYTYDLTGTTANTKYRILITNANNVQFFNLGLIYN